MRPSAGAEATQGRGSRAAWGEQFKRLAEVRGVKLGSKGGRPAKNENPATVAGLAAELGVSERTAQNRVEAANLPEPEKAAVKAGTGS
jgi:hypothetical protein